ncbi:MAG: hypothetical protein QXI85_06840 [Desulfurococcaceae archaeon]
MNELELVRNFYFTTKTKEARYSFLRNPDIPFEDTAIFWISKDDKDAVLFANKNWIFGLESLRRIAKRITSRLKEREDLNPPKELLDEEDVFQHSVKVVLKSYQILELSLEIPNKNDFVLKVFGSFQGKLIPAIFNGKNYSKIIDEYTIDFVNFAYPRNESYGDFLLEIRRIETVLGDRGYFLTYAPYNFHKIEIEPDPDLLKDLPPDVQVSYGIAFLQESFINSGNKDVLSEYNKKADALFEEYVSKLINKN